MRAKVKAALALGSAAALVSGLGGTLAFWNQDLPVGGTAVNGGLLQLVTDATHTGCGAWALDAVGGLTSYTPGEPLVPGDTLTRVCTFTIVAQGKHLRATVGVSNPLFSGSDGNFGGALTATVGALTIDGTPRTSFTSADDGKALQVSVTVEWDPTDVLHQGATSVLDGLTLSAHQVHS